MEDKKNKVVTDTGDHKKSTELNTQVQDTTPAFFSQQLANLPEEILSLPRFVNYGNHDNPKAPYEGWSLPENQRLYSELNGTIGVVASTEYDDSLIFFDFDHVLDDNGNFINDDAEKWFNYLQAQEYFAELSKSGTGIHMFAAPSIGKFSKGRRELNFGGDVKIEIFYGTNKFCLVTGNPFRCEPNAPIAQGDVADEMFQAILDEIKRRQPATDTSPKKSANNPLMNASDTAEYDSFRANGMLDTINPADHTTLPDTDWFAVISACKNIGIPYSDVDAWNKRDPERYNAEENLLRWNSATDPNFDIETLHGIAKRFGYSEKDTRRQWYDLHPELSNSPAPMNDDDKEKFTRTQDKIKSCPVNFKIPNNYLFSVNGIIQLTPSKKVGELPKKSRVAWTPIIPTRKFREPVKGTVEYEFAIFSDGEWNKVEIDGATLTDQRELAGILGKHSAIIIDKNGLLHFLNDVIALNSDILPKIKSYNQTGWTTDDCAEFAYPSTDDKVIIRRAGYDYEKIFKPRGDREEWKKKFVEIATQGGAAARVIIGATCAAPLIKPLEDLPNLQVHVWGKKSIGKTPMLKFAVSIFGDTDVDKLTHTFAATPKSRLETACAFSDLPLICEELESIGAKDAEKLSSDIYNYFLGIGGQALKKDGTKRGAKLFSGVRLTNGEHSLVQSCGNGGEFKRVLDLRCASLLDEDFASDLYGFCKRNHGLFGEQWIKYTIKNRDLISKNYHQTLDAVKTRQKFFGNENDLTQLRTLVISVVAYQHFKICISLSDLENDADAINDEMTADIETITATLPTAAEIDDTARAIEFLQSFTAGNDKFFMHEVDKPEFDNEFTQSTPTCYGKKFKNGEIAFLPHAFKKILEDEGDFKSSDKLRAEFYDKGYLRHTAGRYTYPTWFNGGEKKMIRFKAGIISTAEDDNDEKTATDN